MCFVCLFSPESLNLGNFFFSPVCMPVNVYCFRWSWRQAGFPTGSGWACLTSFSKWCRGWHLAYHMMAYSLISLSASSTNGVCFIGRLTLFEIIFFKVKMIQHWGRNCVWWVYSCMCVQMCVCVGLRVFLWIILILWVCVNCNWWCLSYQLFWLAECLW